MGGTGRRRARAITGLVLAVGLAASGLTVLDPSGDSAGAAGSLPAGFVEETVLSGLTNPTAVRFSPDGRVFVAEKSGVIKVFDSLGDTTPTVFADLRTNVHNFWDRGMLGLALHPDFPNTPYVYVAYTHDAAIGGAAPRWGAAGVSSDPCPTPPGPNGDGCVVSGRVSRLTAAGDVMSGPEQVLLEDWCQQYPSHSLGGLAFGSDGMLYVGGGDGASFNFVDYGQDGNPVNPCGDPGGASPTPPTAEGGALRSQDIRTTGDPVGLNGSILRIDPITGAGLADNPRGASGDANERRIVATGLRNPFRIAIRPGTSEVWAGDVGWGDWEEIDVVANATDGSIDNFGWPCYEGAARQPGYDAADLSICEQLYAQPGGVTNPYFTYRHADKVVPGEPCATGSSSIAGLAFAPASGGNYPASFAGAAFFADYSRGCIWVMKAGPDGRPSPNLVETFLAGATTPVELQVGPDGMLYYVNLGGELRRIRYVAETTPPTVTAVTPAPGATEVSTDVNVTATFSEPLDAATVNTSTVVLRTGAANGPVVSAAVTYDAATNRAVLDPVGPLAAGTGFTAVVKGGSAGVKDLAGNPLTIDRAWSFTTAPAAPGGPANDGFGAAQAVSGANGNISGSNVGATKEAGEPAHGGSPGGASVWYRWVAPSSGQATITTSGSSFDTLLGVYTGSSVSGLTTVASNDDISGSVYQSSVSFTAVAGTTYHVAVDGYRHTSTGIVETGSVKLNWSAAAAGGPTNDGFGAAEAISGATGTTAGSNVGATKEVGEPAHAGNPGGASVWYRWVAPSSGQATITTTGSSFDTLLGVYTGSGVSGLTTVASNDDISGTVYQSSVTFTAAEGTTYQVAVDGWRNGAGVVSKGTITLNWSSPAPPDTSPDAPRPEIVEPASPAPWTVGDVIPFSGTATDPQDGTLAPSALRWSLVLQHCPSNCHHHVVEDYPGVASGSFVAPDHEYPSYLELRLTATDSSGLSTTVTRRLDPRTVDLAFASDPPGLQLVLDGATAPTPFAQTAIAGSEHSVAAPAAQSLGANDYEFVRWSDGGARAHQVQASTPSTTLTAVYRDVTPPKVSAIRPASGANGVSRSVSPTATFSEAMDPSTIASATVKLRVGGATGTPVTATVIYDPGSRAITIDPVPTLASKTAYTVVIEGGVSGVKDLAGNALPSTFTWSFRTK